MLKSNEEFPYDAGTDFCSNSIFSYKSALSIAFLLVNSETSYGWSFSTFWCCFSTATSNSSSFCSLLFKSLSWSLCCERPVASSESLSNFDIKLYSSSFLFWCSSSLMSSISFLFCYSSNSFRWSSLRFTNSACVFCSCVYEPLLFNFNCLFWYAFSFWESIRTLKGRPNSF